MAAYEREPCHDRRTERDGTRGQTDFALEKLFQIETYASKAEVSA